jgi:hypothetical protein
MTSNMGIRGGWGTSRAVLGALTVGALIVGCTSEAAQPSQAASTLAEPGPTTDPAPEPVALTTGSGRLTPGQYEITDLGPFTITITVPAGWESLGVPAMVWSDANDKATVAFVRVTDLYADPCDASAGMASMGPTAGDLVEALDAAPGVTVGSRTDVTVSGYSGTLVEFTTSDPGCGEGNDGLLWTLEPEGQDQSHPGESSLSWHVIDVEGEHLVVTVGAAENTPASDVAEADSIFESIVIEVP